MTTTHSIKIWTLSATAALTLAFSPAFIENAASSPSHHDGDEVSVVLDEWHLTPEKTEVKAGVVKFRVQNLGDEHHELVIVKTDLGHDRLPLDDGKVREDEAGELIGEIEEFPSGETRSATFELKPGNYVLFCNIVEREDDGEMESHYREGMGANIRVVD